MKAALGTLDGLTVSRPAPRPCHPQHLSLDKGYDYPQIEAEARQRAYRAYIRRRGEEKVALDGSPSRPAHRWVVERTGSWHNRFRKLLIRWEKKVQNYLALVHLSCCLIVYRLIVLG